MLRKLLVIFILICATKCKSPSYSLENVYAILDRTSEYFKSLSDAYAASNADVKNDDIDSVIAEYMENTTKAILQRRKRSPPSDLQPSKEVNVLQGFEETLSINLSDFRDIAFISVQNEQRLLWFAAAIDSSKILLYQLVIGNEAQLVGSYPQSNGKRIIVNNYNNGILIVMQKDTDEIVVLCLSKNENGVYELHFKQEFEISGVLHMNTWFGMNQLYLGIASDANVFIYVWLGEYFDKIDTLHFGARKLLPFQNKGFMRIVVVGSSRTRIFRFSVRSNKFVETQKLPGARDAGSFYFKEGHFEEHFLVLAHDDATILYKEMYNRFAPFQRIASAKYVRSLTIENTVILLSAEDDIAGIYQYNGWRFLKLHTVLSNIRQIRQIPSYGEDTLVVQRQNGDWLFLRPIWAVKKTWRSSQNEIYAWCSEIERKASQRNLEVIPDLKDPVKISNVYIDRLRIQTNLNDHNATELIRLTQQYKKIIAKLNLANSTLARITRNAEERSKYTVLHGKKMAIKCRTRCHVRHIDTDTELKSTAKFRKLESTNRVLKFNNLKVKMLDNWKCPIPDFGVDDIFVKESINGISMQSLREKTLKTFGDQEISSKHIFTNLHATNVSIPLNIATYSTKQTLLMKEARVKELHLTDDEFFLPLNGPAVTMNGSITAAKVKITGFVHLRGGLTGKVFEKLMLLKDIFTPLTLSGDYFLQNVTFRNLVKAEDIVGPRGQSLKGILENSIPLDSNVPQQLILSSDRTQWDNVTLVGYNNWVTKNSADTVIISGAKFANNSIVLTNATHANLPTPILTIPICAMEVVTQNIRTSLITLDDLVVQNLHVSHVRGASNLHDVIFDSVSALQNIDFSTKLFTGQVFVKNMSALEIKGIDIKDLKIQMNKWVDVNRLKGPVNISKLVVKNLEVPVLCNLPLPTKVKNVIVKVDSDIEKINGVNMRFFMDNVLKVNDLISLEHATFTHGFTSNYVHASRSTLNLSNLDTHLNLRSKRISTTLKTNAINVPQTFGYAASDVPSTFVIKGTARFEKEPTVQNVKNVNLKKLSEDLWMLNQDTILSGSNMNVKNMTIRANVTTNDSLYSVNSLTTNMWSDLSRRLLSKTKQQTITVASSFKNVEVPAIIAANNSILRSSDSNLEDLLTNSLMKNVTQIVNAVWHFEELNTGNWNNKLNDIDLKTDIVRYDAEQNIITGKKTITDLTTRDLWSYTKKFSNWASGALTKKCRKLAVIKGRKMFNNINLNNLSVKGTIMGRNVEEALLKSGNQTIFGTKKIRGHLNAPSLITDSTVNDVYITQLINDRVKRHKIMQTIETKMDFKNDLEVFGNVTINGLYQRTNLSNIGDRKLDIVLNRATKVMELAEDIKIALHNPAIYVNKFEVTDKNVSGISSIPDENVIVLNSTCLCEPKNISLLCNDTKLLNVLAGTNSSTFRMMKLVLLNDVVFVVIVSSDFVSIYTYAATEQELYRKAGLYVPDVLRASVMPTDNSLWIVLRLPGQTLILRYQVWDELERYVLPASDTLVTDTTPNKQRLLIRSDGVWALEGALHPQHIFKIPLNGEIETFAHGADYYVKVTTANSTEVLKARYVGN